MSFPATDPGTPESREPTLRWYSHAVVCAVRTDFAEMENGIGSVLDTLPPFGVTCLRLLSPALSGDGPRARDTLVAIRSQDLRVIVDLEPSPVCDEDAVGAFADGVVLHNDLDLMLAQLPDAPAPPRFYAVNGVPVPLAVAEAEARELAVFRVQLLETIRDCFARETSTPLLGALIRLALRRLQRRQGRREEHSWHAPAGDRTLVLPRPLTAVLHDDPSRVEIMERLLCSLPGPIQLVYPDDFVFRANDGNETSLATVHALMGARQRSTALRFGTVFPVSLGSGPGVAFVREWQREVVLVAANLGSKACEVECEMTPYLGRTVVDMFDDDQSEALPPGAYAVSLPPYGCRWLRLVRS